MCKVGWLNLPAERRSNLVKSLALLDAHYSPDPTNDKSLDACR